MLDTDHQNPIRGHTSIHNKMPRFKRPGPVALLGKRIRGECKVPRDVALILNGLSCHDDDFVTLIRKRKDLDHMSPEELQDLLERYEYEGAVKGAVVAACLWLGYLLIRLSRSKAK